MCDLSLELVSVEISGFKCFKAKTLIGPLPRNSLICIVGPNGCGKSVIGEAIAFAFGGNAKMLRAHNLASLVSQHKNAATDPTKVTVSLRQQAKDKHAGMTWLKVECVLRGNTTKSRILLEEGGAPAAWQDISLSELHTLLLRYGINTGQIDRYVVTQSRHSIEVQDPVKLLNHLECLLGTAHLADEIRRQEAAAQENKSCIRRDEDEGDRLQELRKSLSPEVAKWHMYRDLKAEVDRTKRQLLTRKEALLRAKLELVTAQAEKLRQDHSALEAQRAAADGAVQEVQGEQRALVKKRSSLSAKVKSARQQAEAGQADVARALSDYKQAQEAAEAGVRMRELAAKRSKALHAKISAASAAEAAAALAQQELEAKVAQLQQQAAESGHESPATADAGDAMAVTLSEKEALLKEAQQRHARAQRELQAVSAKLAAAKAQLAALTAPPAAPPGGQDASAAPGPGALPAVPGAQAKHAHSQVAALQEADQAAARHSHAAAEAKARLVEIDRDMAEVQAQLDAQAHKKALLRQAEEALRALDSANAGPEDGGAGHGKGRWASFDRTVLLLHRAATERARQQQQPRGFHGRLCNILRVTEPAAVAAVNTMLPEVCAPATTLVAADRTGAYEVVAAFKTVGRVTCRVLEELQPSSERSKALGVAAGGGGGGQGGGGSTDGQHGRAEEALLPGGVPGLPLSSVVCGKPGDVPGVERLVEALFGSWAMVGEREGALRVMAAQQREGGGRGVKRWSLVTPRGEVFKADGEISVVLRGRKGDQGPDEADGYGLGGEIRPMEALAAPGGQGPAAAAERAAAEKERQAALRRLASLQQECTGLDAAMAAAQAELRRLLSQRSLAKTSHAAEAKMAAAAAATAAAIRKDAEGLPPVVESLTLRAEQVAERVQAAMADVQACREACDGMRAGEGGGRALKPPNVQQQLKEASMQLSKASDELEARRRDLQRLHSQVHAQEQQALALRTGTDGQADLAKLKSRHKTLLVQAEKLDEKLEQVEGELGKLSEQVSDAESQLAAAKERLELLHSQLAASRTGVGRAEKKAGALQAELGSDAAELEALLAELKQQEEEEVEEGLPAAAEAGAGQRPGMQTRPRRAAAAAARADEDCEEGADFCREVKQQSRKAGGKQKQASKASALAEEEAWVAAAAAAFSAKQEELSSLKEKINTAALQEDLEAMRSLEQVRTRLLEHEAKSVAAAAAIEQLVTQRYALLSQALETTNAELSKVYQYLTGWLGDAYLQYTADKRMLFVSGVAFNVRPDQHRWRPFGSLSGGQQALSTLALSFAMQAAIPSPFYFLDEVDAALDTLHAQRVAEYMLMRSRGETLLHPSMQPAAQAQEGMSVPAPGLGGEQGRRAVVGSTGCCTQYVVVSHKPQVCERASCLVGVYSHASSSLAVTAMMEPTVAL